MKSPFKRDAFGNILIVKRIIIFLFGALTYYRFNMANRTVVRGTRNLIGLPDTKVLFVSNHQTYFADVAAMIHVFGCVKWKVHNRIDFFWHLFNPKLNIYFIAAVETMRKGLLPRLFAYVGSVSIKRTWRAAGQDVDRGVDPQDVRKIQTALENGWVITFPQGTTKPFVPGRRGTARLIKEHRPIVIPVVVEGFRRAFNKRGLLMKKRGVELSLTFKPALDIDYEGSADAILAQIMDSIEQSERFQKRKSIRQFSGQ